jgi:hypothetical protein
VAASFPIHQEIEGASAGVFGLMGGHIGKEELFSVFTFLDNLLIHLLFSLHGIELQRRMQN